MINTANWIAWMVMTLAILLSTRNPFYLIILLTDLLILGVHLSQKISRRFWVSQNLRFIITMMLISTVINAIFTHTGQTLLFKIPQNWILVGGNITLESILYGAINGLVIGCLYLAFNILNLTLTIKQLTRLIPAVFYPIAMMVTISLTFFPSIQKRARAIKEAQMIRGNPMKKVSDWVPLFMPLLVSSLENAFLLSESMTSRGFNSQVSTLSPKLITGGFIVGTLAVFSGWILHLYALPLPVSLVLYFLGGTIVGVILLQTERQSHVTRYTKQEWLTKDIISFSMILFGLASMLVLQVTDQFPPLSYNPFPVITPPEVNLMGIIVCLFPILPAFFRTND